MPWFYNHLHLVHFFSLLIVLAVNFINLVLFPLYFQVIDKVQEETKSRSGILFRLIRLGYIYIYSERSVLHTWVCRNWVVTCNWMHHSLVNINFAVIRIGSCLTYQKRIDWAAKNTVNVIFGLKWFSFTRAWSCFEFSFRLFALQWGKLKHCTFRKLEIT